jgi:hypothetical protein
LIPHFLQKHIPNANSNESSYWQKNRMEENI